LESNRTHDAQFLEYPSYLRWVVPTLAVLLGLSLLLHFWTFYTLYRTRSVIKQQLTVLADEVDVASNDVARLELPIRRAVPVQAAIPVSQQFTVPISTTFALSDEVSIPMLGTSIDVPISMDLPIRTQVPVTISQTVQLSTTVDLDLTVPLDLPIRQTPLGPYLDRLRESLRRLNQQL